MRLCSDTQSQLFDADRLLEDLAKAKDGIEVYKDYLQQGQDRLDAWYCQHKDIATLVTSRSWLVDEIIKLLWHQFTLDHHSNLSLIAVGGYGRSQLLPQSDIDLVILSQNAIFLTEQKKISEFLTYLWDIKLPVSQRVCTLNQCLTLATKDLAFMTSLLEARTLCGERESHKTLQKMLDQNGIWPTRDFLLAKHEEKCQRHNKYNHIEYNLEPNVKSSPGALRDLQMLSWVTRRHFGAQMTLQQLVKAEILAQTEYQELINGRNLLWRIRWGLHYLSKRPEDRLLFHYQSSLAKLFGLKDNAASLAVEQLMQNYYAQVMQLGQIVDLVVQHFADTILTPKPNPTVITPINEHFQIRNNYIEARQNEIFAKNPSTLLEIFVLLTQHPNVVGVRAATIRLIYANSFRIDEAFRLNHKNNKLFLELLEAPYALTATLKRMLRYGVLSRFIPEFAHIVGQMQHDLFHIFTVDAHTLLLIKFLRSFSYQKSQDQFPVASSLIFKIKQPNLLYLAGLFHDIAKGRGGDHSKLGAKDALRFCKRLGLPLADRKLVAWLVRYHLLMSTTAQRKDLTDLNTIYEFAKMVKNRETLDYLYCLTVADINATNPKLWNNWRASLLRKLYFECKNHLQKGLDSCLDQQQRINELQKKALLLLQKNTIDQKAIESLWQTLGKSYFKRHSPEEIAWHSAGIIAHGQTKEPLILIRETSSHKTETGSQIFLYTPDCPNLFATTVIIMDQQQLSIHDARIITSTGGFSLDTFTVLTDQGQSIGKNPKKIEKTIKQLKKAIQKPKDYSKISRRRLSRRIRYFHKPARVVLSSNIEHKYTAIEIFCLDYPGLLARLGLTFMQLQLMVQGAKIATLGERAEDIFFVTNPLGKPIFCANECKIIQQTLCKAIDQIHN